MSSISSLRNTTFPGVAARLSPSSNDEVSTWRGRPLWCTRSSRKFRDPAATLAPPVSNALFSAAGLVGRKLVGARASKARPTASCAFWSVTGSPRPAASRSSPSCRAARYAWRSANQPGLPSHDGSAKRLSRSSTGTGGSRSDPSQRATAAGPASATAAPNRSQALPTSSGWPAARPSTDSSELPKSTGSTWANTLLSGPSTSLASAPTCHAVASCGLMFLLPCRASCPLEDGGDALAAADAHGDQGVVAAGAVQFVQRLDGQDRSGGADRVAEGDAAAVGVGLVRRQPELSGHGERLGGEGLVQLDHVDLVELHPGPVEHLAHGGRWAHAHDPGLDPGVAVGDQAPERGVPVPLGEGRVGQHHGGGGVVDPGRVARGDGAALGELRLELGQVVHRHVRPDVLVGVDDLRALL